MIRSTNRRTLLLAASALTLGLASGCGAGQVTQTEGQQPPVSGVNVTSADKLIQIRNLAVVYKDPAGYPAGGTAPLQVYIASNGNNTVKLVSVTADLGTVVLGGPAAAAASSAPAAPSASASASASAGASAGASGSANPSASAGASASAPPSPATPPAPNTKIDVSIPSREFVVLNPTQTRFLQVINLSKPFKPGDSLQLQFRFDNGTTITTEVPMAIPMTAPPRSPMELHEEEGAGGSEH
ncbi:hypothetical protein [Virgisporangium aliadipatigenens]|uniref:hypothetical protein n=1 Tax=Virgisporangium aliadipatigenens TaxID=741659 RepID=UPI001945245D|nr:hypothetical protein [Virgisporangium aliadipatigenens]